MITMVQTDNVSRELYDRLYNEAYPKTSLERARLGDTELADGMFNGLALYKTAVYYLDGYPVGVVSYQDFQYNGNLYFFHRYPTYGTDENGSRAWWYSEEFQRVFSEYVRARNYIGVIAVIHANPEDSGGTATKKHFGSFNKYFKVPVAYPIDSILGPNMDWILPGGNCLVIDLM